MAMQFRDRRDAGRRLAARLVAYAGRPAVLVLALPRGGVPVAFEIATALHAPLDVFLVRKLGVPGYEELAMGAIATGGVRVLNEGVVQSMGIPPHVIDAVIATQQRELERRERAYRDDAPAPELRDRTILLVDDGMATGSSMRVAVAALRQRQPARIVVAIPVAAPSTCDELAAEADEIVCLSTPDPFFAVGLWYEDFAETTDAEVRDLLDRAARAREMAPAPPGEPWQGAGEDGALDAHEL